NTLGAILGVFLAVHVLIPAIGLRLAVTLAALVDVALGIWLLTGVVRSTAPRRVLALAAASALVVLVSLQLGKVDPRSLASGVFRSGAILGVFLAVHVLIPAIGLRLAVTLAALVDVALGIWLLTGVVRSTAPRRVLALAAASALVVLVSLQLGKVDPRSLASGVF